MAEFSPKFHADQAASGGRLYRGRRLFQPAPWFCPSCGQQNAGTVEQGCANMECLTRQERPKAPTTPKKASPTGRLMGAEPEPQRLPLTSQLRTQRLTPGSLTPTDLLIVEDRIVHRLTEAMDERLLTMAQGGLSPAAQATVAEALGLLVLLVEEEQVQLGPHLLSLDEIRSLALTFTSDQQEPYADPSPTPRTSERTRTEDPDASDDGLPDWLSAPSGGPDGDGSESDAESESGS